MQDKDLQVALPAHTRIAAMALEERTPALRVILLGSDAAFEVAPDMLGALFGARIRYQAPVHDQFRINPVQAFVTASTWPRSLRPHTRVPDPTIGETDQGSIEFVLGLRIENVKELWYLIAESFNFRDMLGSRTGYSTQMNFVALVDCLVRFAPRAEQDQFVNALQAHRSLPHPLNSLAEFFRATSGKSSWQK